MWLKWILNGCFVLFACKAAKLIECCLPVDILNTISNQIYIKIALSVIVLFWYFDLHRFIKLVVQTFFRKFIDVS